MNLPTIRTACAAAATLALLLSSCAAVAAGPPDDAVPLADLEEPGAWRQPPDDEAARQELPRGSFTGIRVAATSDELDDLLGGSEGVRVEAVVENSPAAAAGIEPDDLLLEVAIADAAPQPVDYPSQWRRAELDCPTDGTLTVLVDRAGVEQERTIRVEPRYEAPDRESGERLREQARVGVVVRTATEVEARAAGLGPGGGAVVVGLARSSPWRTAGVRFGDLIHTIDGRQVAHPNVVLEAIRDAGDDVDTLRIELVRDGDRAFVDAPLSSRTQETSSFWLPPLYSYDKDRDRRSHSFLLGLFHYESTTVAWDFRMFWLFRFSGGDADTLLPVEDR